MDSEQRSEVAPWLSKTPVEEQQPPWMRRPTAVQDIEAIAPRAARTGVELLAAGPGEAAGMVSALPRKVMEMMVRQGWMDPQKLAEYDQAMAATGANSLVPDLSTVRKYVTDPILGPGQDVPAQTIPGRYARTALEMGPSVALNPGSIWSKVLQLAGITAGTEGAGQVAENLNLPPWAQDTARLIGGGVGAFAPSMWNRIASPHPMPSGHAPHVRELRTRNIPMTAGQITASPRLLAAEATAGGVPAAEGQSAAFTREALKEQGGFPAGADVASRKTMATELGRMGNEFDRIQLLSSAPFDASIQNELLRVVQDYTERTPNTVPFIENTMNNLAQNAARNGGMLSGEAYKLTRSQLNDVIRNTEDDGLRSAAMDMQDALDNHIQQFLPPEEQAAWRTVRSQYRNYLPIEHAKAAGGAASARGVISPLALKAGIKAIEGKREIASGKRPMTDLAEAGAAVLEKFPTSGTSERLRSMLATLVPAAGGLSAGTAALASGMPGPVAAGLGAAGLLGSVVGPAVKNALVTSEFGQNLLARQGPQVRTAGNTLAALMQMAREQALQRQQDVSGRKGQ